LLETVFHRTLSFPIYIAKSNGGTYISLETDVGNRMLCSWTTCGVAREVCLRLGYDLLIIEVVTTPGWQT